MPPGYSGSLIYWSNWREVGRRHTPQNTRPSRGRNAPVYTINMTPDHTDRGSAVNLQFGTGMGRKRSNATFRRASMGVGCGSMGLIALQWGWSRLDGAGRPALAASRTAKGPARERP